MLENLPHSFLSELHIDPFVGMVSMKLHKSCGVSRIDAWKFVTSHDMYRMARSMIVHGENVSKGIESVAIAKAASGDNEFIFIDIFTSSLFEVVVWACRFDAPRILAPCFAALHLEFMTMRKKTHLIWRFADYNGITRVLSWFLENQPDIMKAAIPFIPGDHINIVQWCIENLFESSPALVNWVMMKVNAIIDKNAEFMALLDWVVVPPCNFDGTFILCGLCPACMIRTSFINYKYFYPVE